MTKVINIDVEGGLIQEIRNIPKGVMVTVCDRDIPNEDTGEKFTVTEYWHREEENMA